MERNETLAVKWYNQIDYNQTTREILRLQSDQLHSKETNVMKRNVSRKMVQSDRLRSNYA